MKWAAIFLTMALLGIIASVYVGWGIGNKDTTKYELQISALQSELNKMGTELEQATKPISLENRFANLMEALAENGIMKYDVDIKARLLSDDMPDIITVTLHLKEGQIIDSMTSGKE